MDIAKTNLVELFKSLVAPNTDKVDKSTLLALLLYTNMDSEQPEFFSYVKKTIEAKDTQSLNQEEFLKLFLDPQISYQKMELDDMVQIFKIFDVDKKGSFSADNFLSLYTQSSEYKLLDEIQKEQIQNKIRNDFQIISQSKEITPIEFYSMLTNFNN